MQLNEVIMMKSSKTNKMNTKNNNEVFKTIKKENSTIEFLKNPLRVKKTYHSRVESAQLEFETIQTVNTLLKKHDLSKHSYEALEVGHKKNSLITSFVKGISLEEFLQQHNTRLFRNKKITKQLISHIKVLGKIFSIVQSHNNFLNEKLKSNKKPNTKNNFKELHTFLMESSTIRSQLSSEILDQIISQSTITSSIFKHRRIFAMGAQNFIITPQNVIVPIDMGSKESSVYNLLQLARFTLFLTLSGIKPKQLLNYNFKTIKVLEKTLLESYFNIKTLQFEDKMLFSLFKIKALEELNNYTSKTSIEKLKTLYLNSFKWYSLRSLKKRTSTKKIKQYYLKKVYLEVQKFAPELNWMYYKGDITYPHLCSDIDVLCSANQREVEKTLIKLGFKEKSPLLFEKYGIVFHIHPELKTHYHLFFVKDIGEYILKFKKNETPQYIIWVIIRTLYMIQRPKGWIKKQLKRII